MSKPSSALIIGCGYLGLQLKILLKEKGWYVKGARRTAVQENCYLAIDVGSPFSLDRHYDVVFYMVSAGSYTPAAYQLAYAKGVENTIKAIRTSTKTPRLIYVSSTSLFSENDGGIVTEDSPVKKASFAEASLAMGESLVSSSGQDYSIVRLSGIYGPKRCRLVELVKSRKALLKKTVCISNRIHVDDCAGILHHLTTLPNLDQLYIGSDSEPTPYNDVIQWLAKVIGVRELATESQASNSAHMSNKRCSNKRIIHSGYTFKYPSFREGFLSCL